MAYNQTIAALEAADERFLAGSIEGDETQHFIVLVALIAGLVQPGSNLSADSADEVFPRPFVRKVGESEGLETLPDYFACVRAARGSGPRSRPEAPASVPRYGEGVRRRAGPKDRVRGADGRSLWE